MGYLMTANLNFRTIQHGPNDHIMVGDGKHEVQFNSADLFRKAEPSFVLPEENVVEFHYEPLRRKMSVPGQVPDKDGKLVPGTVLKVVDVYVFYTWDPETDQSKQYHRPYPDPVYEAIIDRVEEYAEMQKRLNHPVLLADGLDNAKAAAKIILNQMVDAVTTRDQQYTGYSATEERLFAEQMVEAALVKKGAKVSELSVLPALVVEGESLESLADKVLDRGKVRDATLVRLQAKRQASDDIQKMDTPEDIFQHLDAMADALDVQSSMVFQ